MKGRPRLYARPKSPEAKVNTSILIAEGLRRQLVRAASENGGSLNREITKRLAASFGECAK